jgi:acetylornithine/succinyldiaminopimelate/putrescine aminotransferase
MTSAKGLGGGLPIGCIMSTKKVDVFSAGDHGSTFGGNVLTCAGAYYVANKLFNSDMIKIVQSTTKILDNILNDLLHEHDDIVKLRGMGLLRGIEFKNEIAPAIAQECLNNGLLVNAVRPNVLRLMPALNVSSNELKKACAIIAKSIDSVR